MKRITCENCGRSYDFDRDEFCPRCGTFNQPVKTWGVDAKGSVVRVDGVNERDHDGSFVHKEFHHEQDVRKRMGMDWQRPKAPERARPVSRPAAQKSGSGAWKKLLGHPLARVAIAAGVLYLLNYVLLFVNRLLALL